MDRQIRDFDVVGFRNFFPFGDSRSIPLLLRGDDRFGQPFLQSAFDREDFSADARLFFKGVPPRRRDTLDQL